MKTYKIVQRKQGGKWALFAANGYIFVCYKRSVQELIDLLPSGATVEVVP